jgi:hypothetical protein
VDGGALVIRRWVRARLVRRRERGAVAVEFALVLPLLLLLLLGGIDWGYYFFVSEIVANAAREGARAASVERQSATICNVGGPARTMAFEYMKRGRLVVDDTDSRLRPWGACSDPDRSCCQPDTITPASGPSYSVVQVRVTYSFRPSSPSMSLTGFLPSYLLPPRASATATMRLEP